MTPAYEDRWLTVWGGDAREILRTLPAASVHMVVTSPPYYGLRDYGLPPGIWGGDPGHDHAWGELQRGKRKDILPSDVTTLVARTGTDERQNGAATNGGRFCECGAWSGQLGLEPSPELYVDHLVDVFREIRRVLRPDGTAWLNLGDSFAGTSTYNASQSMHTANGWKQDAPRRPSPGRPEGVKPKDLIGVPWMAAFALRADGWWLRRDVIWAKPNGMPESVEDRPSSSHEYLFLLSPSEIYFYDAWAVKEPLRPSTIERERGGGYSHAFATQYRGSPNETRHQDGKPLKGSNPAGRNLRSVWHVATQPYPGAHYAVMPTRLVEPCVRAGTSEHGVCGDCGAPWRREVIETDEVADYKGSRFDEGKTAERAVRPPEPGERRVRRPTGRWLPTCKHPDAPIERAVVLDPFAGSGTAGLVAQALGRRAVLIDLNPEYLQQCLRRTSREWGVGGPELVDDGTAQIPEDSLWAG